MRHINVHRGSYVPRAGGFNNRCFVACFVLGLIFDVDLVMGLIKLSSEKSVTG